MLGPSVSDVIDEQVSQEQRSGQESHDHSVVRTERHQLNPPGKAQQADEQRPDGQAAVAPAPADQGQSQQRDDVQDAGPLRPQQEVQVAEVVRKVDLVQGILRANQADADKAGSLLDDMQQPGQGDEKTRKGSQAERKVGMLPPKRSRILPANSPSRKSTTRKSASRILAK